MTWSSFTLLVAVCYAAYYGLNVLLDALRSSNAGPSDGTETLVVAEAHSPTVISGFEDDVIGLPGPDFENMELDGPEETPEGEAHGGTAEAEERPIAPSPLSGGVEYLDFIKLCRQKAIVEAAKHEFA